MFSRKWAKSEVKSVPIHKNSDSTYLENIFPLGTLNQFPKVTALIVVTAVLSEASHIMHASKGIIVYVYTLMRRRYKQGDLKDKK